MVLPCTLHCFGASRRDTDVYVASGSAKATKHAGSNSAASLLRLPGLARVAWPSLAGWGPWLPACRPFHLHAAKAGPHSRHTTQANLRAASLRGHRRGQGAQRSACNTQEAFRPLAGRVGAVEPSKGRTKPYQSLEDVVQVGVVHPLLGRLLPLVDLVHQGAGVLDVVLLRGQEAAIQLRSVYGSFCSRKAS